MYVLIYWESPAKKTSCYCPTVSPSNWCRAVTKREAHHCPHVIGVQLLSHVWLFVTPWVRFPCPLVSPGVCPDSFPLTQWYYLTTLSSATHFSSCPQSFPASGSFLNQLAIHSKWPNYWSLGFSISLSNKYSGLISFRKSPYPNVNPVMTHRRHKTKTYKAFCQIIKTQCRAFQA